MQIFTEKKYFFKTLFVPRVRRVCSPPQDFILCTIFGRMLVIEPKLLRLQPGVLPMSYTHPQVKNINI